MVLVRVLRFSGETSKLLNITCSTVYHTTDSYQFEKMLARNVSRKDIDIYGDWFLQVDQH